jgi:hypothetical protein
MRALFAIFLAFSLSGCGGPPAVQVLSTLKTALDTRCVAARLLDMDDICPEPGEPGPEPARYCYRTLGVVDCYAAPEAEARNRNVVVASPAIEAADD